MKTLIAAALLASFAGCQTTANVEITQEKSADGITLKAASPERLTGSYVDVNGGIEFDTARTGDQLFIHLATKSGHVLVHAETTADSYVFKYLDSRLTLEVSKAWIATVQAEGEGGPAAQDDSQMHWTGDTAVLDEMLALPEVKSLPTLSRALGMRGYTGSEFPASLALHKVARQSADALGINVEPIVQTTDENGYCEAYPNWWNSCYGMCGSGCNCWSWVCGDCCYHTGCAVHDDWCRQGKWWYCYNITAVIALFGC